MPSPSAHGSALGRLGWLVLVALLLACGWLAWRVAAGDGGAAALLLSDRGWLLANALLLAVGALAAAATPLRPRPGQAQTDQAGRTNRQTSRPPCPEPRKGRPMTRLLHSLTTLMILTLTATPLAGARLDLPEQPAADSPAFGDVWYQGTAEITSYRLEQARYGEIHEGHAVLIYVTEEFSRQRHVKLDGPPGPGEEAVKVMKLNSTRKFLTGIYPYSLMTSVFSPVHPAEGAGPLKITTSSQEWCGHTFAQLDRAGDGFHLRAFSYFGSEGDEDRALAAELTEDGLWNRVRLDPASLPTGSFELVPGTQYARLRHVPFEVHPAEGTLTADPADPEIAVYRLEYPTLERNLTIRFRRDFPHEIEAWEESHPSGFGPDARRLTTRATKIERTMTAYWRQNGAGDRGLRQSELGLGE